MVNISVAFKIPHRGGYGSVHHLAPFTRLVHALTVPLHYLFRPTPCTALVAASVLVHVEVGIGRYSPRERRPLIHISILQRGNMSTLLHRATT